MGANKIAGNMFNFSFTEGIIPSQWKKKHIAVPVPKQNTLV